MTSIAFVTKSYEPDRARCELLCRSIELLAPGAHHWIIVDARDLPAFRNLEGPSTRVVTTEELLPRRVWKLELHGLGIDKNIWLSGGTRPMRGWLVQQLAKLAISRVADEDILIHADSDVVLIRRFSADMLQGEGQSFPLFRIPAAVDERLPTHVRWHRTAERLLGLERRPLPLPDYIGGLVPWRRDVVWALLDEIAKGSRRDWVQTLASARELSEYILYGRFVDDLLGKTQRQPAAVPVAVPLLLGLEPDHELRARGIHRSLGTVRDRRDDLRRGRYGSSDLCRSPRAALARSSRVRAASSSARTAGRGQRFVDADVLGDLVLPGEFEFPSSRARFRP